MAMLFPANPNTIEAAYMKVMMNLLVELNLSGRRLLPIERKKSLYVKRSDVNSKQGYLDSLYSRHSWRFSCSAVHSVACCFGESKINGKSKSI